MSDNEKVLLMIEMRTKIALDYCIQKGWPTDATELTFEQLIEIRSLDSWKNVPKEIEHGNR